MAEQEATSVVDVDALRLAIRKQERDDAEKHFKELLEIWKATELADLDEKMSFQIQKDVQELVDKWIAEQGPPSKDQIQVLLDQEYATFPLKVRVEDTSDNPATETGYTEMEFVITELPQTIEKEFFKKFKKQILDLAPQINAWVQSNMDKSVEDRVRGFLETVDGGMELMAEAVVLVLNPRGKKAYVTKEWVQFNVSSLRQWNILQAQLDASKLRDFFSRVSRSGREIQTTITPPSSQKLREQVRS